ncbi:hypothetical protein QWA68_015074 [Fusarium oxysporum]|nr:hypothetical protein QWA68_015074 [Fusarium oxysporum]
MDSFFRHTPSDRESSIAATIETASEIPDRQSLPSDESSTSTTPKRKRITTADAMWQHTRKPQGSESERAGPKQDLVFYCKYCSNPPYSTYVSTTFRNHLLKIHSVEAAGSEPNSTKTVRTSLSEAGNSSTPGPGEQNRDRSSRSKSRSSTMTRAHTTTALPGSSAGGLGLGEMAARSEDNNGANNDNRWLFRLRDMEYKLKMEREGRNQDRHAA